MKKIAIFSIIVIGLLSLSLTHNASANEAAFRAVEKAWQEIQANGTLPIIPTPNDTNYGMNATSTNATGNLGSSNSTVPVMP